jgi:hypothetical protein
LSIFQLRILAKTLIIHIGANAENEIDKFSTTRPRLFQKEAEELWENDNTNYKEQQGNLKLVESN